MEEGEKDVRKRKMSEDMRVGCEKGGGGLGRERRPGSRTKSGREGKKSYGKTNMLYSNNGIMRRARR